VVLPALVLTTESWSGKKKLTKKELSEEQSGINIYRDNNEENENEVEKKIISF
jgi:hypothetical protein